MVPNLLSPHPFNAPLLPLLRFRASSLSSPRREIGLMKLKGMGLSQHCGFQWHCLILPPLLSVPPPSPQPNSLRTRITVTIYNTPHKRSLSHTLHQCILLSLSERQLSGKRWGGKKSDWPISLGIWHAWGTSNYQPIPVLKWIRYLAGKRERDSFKVKEIKRGEVNMKRKALRDMKRWN